MTRARENLLTPELAGRLRGLEIKLARIVDGLHTGGHRSPHRGTSAVFQEHRAYRPGDDPRTLDWKAYARTDRPTVKLFEQESQLCATLLLDISGSMQYAGKADTTKFEHATILLGALSYMLTQQGDRVGAIRFSNGADAHLGARSSNAHLDALFDFLAADPVPSAPTSLAKALRENIDRLGKRGFVAIASDFLDLDPDALHALRHLRSRGHAVLLIQILTHEERALPFAGLVEFEGTEGEGLLETDVEALRSAYVKEINAHLARVRDAAKDAGAILWDSQPTDTVEQIVLELSKLRGGRAWAF